MSAWIGWLVAAGALAVVEMLTLTVVAGSFAGGGLVAALLAAVGVGIGGQIGGFAVVSALLLAFGLPALHRWQRRRPQPALVGAATLVGKPAVVVRGVDGTSGQVKINGELWSARSYVHTHTFPPGTVVEVVEIDGVTALVYPEEKL